MPNDNNEDKIRRESLFLNEHLMAALTVFKVGAGLISLIFFRDGLDSFDFFALLVKLITAVSMYFAFKSYLKMKYPDIHATSITQ